MKVLLVLILIFVITLLTNAQKDCGWGIKLYVRDESGNIIKNPKLEMIGSNVPHYYSTKDFHNWGEPMGTGGQGGFLLKVEAKGYEKFEKIVNFPYCDEHIFELKLKLVDSTKSVNFVRLTHLSGFIEDQNNERVKGIKVILTDKEGKKFESIAENGLYNFEIYSGEYSVELLGFQNSESIKVGKMNFEKESIRLNVKITNDNQLSEKKADLICKHYSNKDESTWCNLIVTLSK